MFRSILGIIAVVFSLYTLDNWKLLPENSDEIRQEGREAYQQYKHKSSAGVGKVKAENKLSFTERIAAKQHKVEVKSNTSNRNIVRLIKTL